MHYFGIITTLPFSKYASPIFAQRKPNDRLRLLVGKINNLISDDYINNNHPVSTLTGATQHLAGKKLFCNLDCSQAYHVLQMADQKSIPRFQLRQQDVCLPQTGPRTELLTVIILQLHEGILGQGHRGG